MNEEGLFILYRIANLFLACDYEGCMRLCKLNFSYSCNGPFFEANFLRYKALCLQMLFDQDQAILNAQKTISQ